MGLYPAPFLTPHRAGRRPIAIVQACRRRPRRGVARRRRRRWRPMTRDASAGSPAGRRRCPAIIVAVRRASLVMLADLFTARHATATALAVARHRSGWWSRSPGDRACWLWAAGDAARGFQRHAARRPLRALLHACSCASARCSPCSCRSTTSATSRSPAGEYYALVLLSTSGMILPRRRERPDRPLPGARDHVGGGLRARRAAPPPRRARPRRRSSTSSSAPSRAASCSTASPSSTAPTGSTRLDVDRARGPSDGLGRRTRWLGMALLLVGLRLQGGAGPVPRLDARRLRGLADGGHRLHGGRREGGRVRGLRARVHGRRSRGVATSWSGRRSGCWRRSP